MKTNRLFLLIILVIYILGCSSKPKMFIIEQPVKKYVENIYKFENSDNALFIFLTGFTSGCQPCEEGTKAFIDSISKFKKTKDLRKYIIISDNNDDSYKKILNDNYTIFSENKYALQRRGIDYPYNFIIEFNNKYEVVYWDILVSGNFETLLNYYQ